MKARVWIWIVVGVVLILFGYLFFQGSPAPSESYELSAPDTIAITQGTEGSINGCLLYTSPSPRDQRGSRMPSSA